MSVSRSQSSTLSARKQRRSFVLRSIKCSFQIWSRLTLWRNKWRISKAGHKWTMCICLRRRFRWRMRSVTTSHKSSTKWMLTGPTITAHTSTSASYARTSSTFQCSGPTSLLSRSSKAWTLCSCWGKQTASSKITTTICTLRFSTNAQQTPNNWRQSACNKWCTTFGSMVWVS